MIGEFALGSFLSRWRALARHDLSASESATFTLAELIAMAEPEARQRWRALSLGYAEPHGAAWLRAAIAARHDGVAADDVLCCAGAQEALACVVRALLAPGDHAIVVVPMYQPSEHAVTSICAATGVPLEERRGGWHLDIDRVATAIRPATRLLLMNFPNSPTGAALEPGALAALVALCRRHGLWLVNDEVYRVMASDRTPPPVADVYERGISVDALSKGFGLPGLRVGWAVCRDRVVLARMLHAKSGLSSCLGAANEVLGDIALRAEASIVGRNRAIARANLGLLRDVLTRHGAVFDGGIGQSLAFAAPRYRAAGDAGAFAIDLLRAAGVLLLPSGLWRSPLAQVPADRLRIGLGAPEFRAALAALDAHLVGRRRHVLHAGGRKRCIAADGHEAGDPDARVLLPLEGLIS